MRRGQLIRQEQRARLENLGEKVHWVTDEEGVQQLMVMIKSNGTLFQLDTALGDWVTLADGRALTNIQRTPTWPFTSGNRNLTDEQVALPSFVGDMPGDYALPRYEYSEQWLICSRSRRRRSKSPRFKRSRPQPQTRRVDVVSINQRQDYLWHHLDGCTTRSDDSASPIGRNGSDGNDSTSDGSNLSTSTKC